MSALKGGSARLELLEERRALLLAERVSEHDGGATSFRVEQTEDAGWLGEGRPAAGVQRREKLQEESGLLERRAQHARDGVDVEGVRGHPREGPAPELGLGRVGMEQLGLGRGDLEPHWIRDEISRYGWRGGARLAKEVVLQLLQFDALVDGVLVQSDDVALLTLADKVLGVELPQHGHVLYHLLGELDGPVDADLAAGHWR